eukprot:733913_1
MGSNCLNSSLSTTDADRTHYTDFVKHRDETEIKCNIESLDPIIGIWRIGRSAGSQSPGGVLILQLDSTQNNGNIIQTYKCVFEYGPPNGDPYHTCYHFYKYSLGNFKIVRCNATEIALRLIASQDSILEYTDSILGHKIETKHDTNCDFLACDKFGNPESEDLDLQFVSEDFDRIKQFIEPNCRLLLKRKLKNIEWNDLNGESYLMLILLYSLFICSFASTFLTRGNSILPKLVNSVFICSFSADASSLPIYFYL